MAYSLCTSFKFTKYDTQGHHTENIVMSMGIDSTTEPIPMALLQCFR
mgnify:CR=1 FL=1